MAYALPTKPHTVKRLVQSFICNYRNHCILKITQKFTKDYLQLHHIYYGQPTLTGLHVVTIVSVRRGQLWHRLIPGCLENMKQGRLLVIIDDARVSRLICRVAERFELSCLAINKIDDISTSYKKSRPDVILLDPNPWATQGRDVLRKLAEQHADAAIVLTSVSPDQTGQLEDLGDSLGLNMAGVLPDVFDVDILNQKFISIFQRSGQQPYIAGNILP